MMNDSHPLRQFIGRYTHLPDDEWFILLDCFEKATFAKNQMLLSEGNICKYFYFLEKGLIRFFILHDGNDVTTYFVESPYCFTARESLQGKLPAHFNIQALTDCVVWQISHESILSLSGLPSWQNFLKSFISEVQGYIELLMIENKTCTAEERYNKLLERQPDLTEKIQLKHLSGFLGIAPQSLSRIRKKTQKNKLN